MRLKMMGGGGSVDYDNLTATASDVPEGLSFIGRGSDDEQTGALPNMENMHGAPGRASDPTVPIHAAVSVKTEMDSVGNKRILLAPPRGKYPGTERAFVGCYPVDIGISSEKIANGESIAGIDGSYGSDSTVSTKDIRNGKVAYGKNGRIVGDASDFGKITRTISAGESLTLSEGFYGESKITAKDLASQTSGNLDASRMVSGQNGFSNGKKVNGSMADRGAYQWAGRGGHGDGGFGSGVENGVPYYAFNNAPDGWYHNQGDGWSPELRLERSTVRASLNIYADNIRKGVTVADIVGTWYGNKACISAMAYRGFGVSTSEYETYNEQSFTMPANGTVYYGGCCARYGTSEVRCEIWRGGTLVDSRNIGTGDSWSVRGTMFNKSFTASAGEVIKVIAAATRGSHVLTSMQAVIVY